MINESKKIRKHVIAGIIAIVIISSIVIFLSSTTYVSCYVMSIGVKEGYIDKQISLLPEYQQESLKTGRMSIEGMNPTPEFIQDAGYNYCLSFAPGLPENINVEFESDEEQ